MTDVKEWLASDGFKVYVELMQGPVGEVLSLLQDGCITRSKAAEAIAELLAGRTPELPEDRLSEFGEDELPGETVQALRQELHRVNRLEETEFELLLATTERLDRVLTKSGTSL